MSRLMQCSWLKAWFCWSVVQIFLLLWDGSTPSPCWDTLFRWFSLVSLYVSSFQKPPARQRWWRCLERAAAEHLRPDERSQPPAVLPAHPRKIPTPVCSPETATTKTSASTISGPEPFQTSGTEETLGLFRRLFIYLPISLLQQKTNGGL